MFSGTLLPPKVLNTDSFLAWVIEVRNVDCPANSFVLATRIWTPEGLTFEYNLCEEEFVNLIPVWGY